jgi:hypothetical protein
LKLIQEITRRRRLCEEVAHELNKYVQLTVDLDPSQAFCGTRWAGFRSAASSRRKKSGRARIGSFSEQHEAVRSDRAGC